MSVVRRCVILSTIALLAALPVLSAACGGDDKPSVTITTPKEGETLDASDVQVAVETESFDVVDKLGEAPKAGEGHVHYYLDVAEVPTTQGEPAVTDEGTYHASATKSFTWEDVEAGEHTLAVQLVNNDHTPLDPPVVEQVTIEIEGSGTGGGSPTRTPGTSTRTPAATTPAGTQAATPTPSQSPAPTSGSSPTPTP